MARANASKQDAPGRRAYCTKTGRLINLLPKYCTRTTRGALESEILTIGLAPLGIHREQMRGSRRTLSDVYGAVAQD